MVRAVVRAMGVTALKGNRPAQAGFTELVARLEKQDYDTRGELFQQLIEQQVEGRKVIKSYVDAGKEPPEMVPHPDDIVFDVRNNRAMVRGPFDEEQKKAFDQLIELRDETAELASEWPGKYHRARKPERKARLLELWHSEQKLFDGMNDKLPSRYHARLKDRSWADGGSRPGDSAEVEWE